MADDAVLWTGWARRRRGARWQPVVEAPTIDQCARLLDVAARRRGIASNTNQVMTRGGYPRDGAAGAGTTDRVVTPTK